METRHVKIDHEDALNAKKQLLSTELNLLHILRKQKNYALLRKKDIAQINKMKVVCTAIKAKYKTLISTFPKESLPKPKKEEKYVEEKFIPEPIIEKKVLKSAMETELDKIREKLDKLNRNG